EWADKNGADIISSSLGYTLPRYETKDMNGRTSIATQAAEMAASKGILVINSAGNEGNKNWEVIGSPADADNVLAIGAIDPYNDAHINFSSFGPTADGKLKPNVSSLGQAIVANKNGYQTQFGTSFSCPLVAGFAACAWQSNPEWTRAEIFTEIEKSGHLYPYYDYAHGYGIPQASYFTGDKKQLADHQFKINAFSDYVLINFNEEFFNEDKKQKLNFYYGFINEENKVVSFGVLQPDSTTLNIIIPKYLLSQKIKYKMQAHFEGDTQVIDLEDR
ncbi:MAG: S8 family serine peptidase, partial [Nitrosopumilus sp.]|nr:S8 family serine peptidase [Nitrosopumilus sp.]